MIEPLGFIQTGYDAHCVAFSRVTIKGVEYLKTLNNPHLYNEYEGTTNAGRALLWKMQQEREREREAELARIKADYDRANAAMTPPEASPKAAWWRIW